MIPLFSNMAFASKGPSPCNPDDSGVCDLTLMEKLGNLSFEGSKVRYPRAISHLTVLLT
jgi:hypothetical protein